MTQHGASFGPYEILGLIGTGGMGEVFRARDTRLGRIVAIKRCRERFSDRFLREATAISALNHPHVCTLYDIGPDYLVMEYVEGKPIAGPLPPAIAVSSAVQILDALDAAHRRGIVHRDLKPSNILVTSAGIKLLDFGLAKIFRTPNDDNEHPDAGSTTTLTAEHTVLGTPGYMAPEQVEGRRVDHRADIFAFGCVLFECLTGSPAFQGKSTQSIFAATLTRDPPPLSAIQPGCPAGLQRVLNGCFQKDPEKRWQSAYDVRLALEANAAAPEVKADGHARWRIPAAIAGLVIALAAVYFLRPHELAPQPRVVTIPAPDGGVIVSATVSPNGKSVALVSNGKLWIQLLGSVAPVAVDGGDGASSPFWSPDSREIAFFAGGKLMRATVGGGSPQVVATVSSDATGAWSPVSLGPSPFIVFSLGVGGLHRVAASGGAITSISSLQTGETRHLEPAFLPDGRLLYRVQGSASTIGIRIARLTNNGAITESQMLVPDGKAFAYVEPPGARNPVLFFWRGVLLASAFDERANRLIGEPVPLASRDPGFSGLDAISASEDARVLILFRSSHGYAEVVALNAAGEDQQILAPLGVYLNTGLSRDGNKLALAKTTEGNLDIWVYDTARGTTSRLTSDPAADGVPVWSPDGAHLAFATWRNGISDIYITSGAGAGAAPEVPLVRSSVSKYPCDWSLDGSVLIYEVATPATGWDLWTVPLSPGPRAGQPVPLLTSTFNERDGRISPNGKWLAYVSDETGREEVYLRMLAGGAIKLQISTLGGIKPEWGPAGSGELYFASTDGDLMSVAVTAAPRLATGTPRKLFAAGVRSKFLGTQFALRNDGTRFFILRPAALPDTRVVLALDWKFPQD